MFPLNFKNCKFSQNGYVTWFWRKKCEAWLCNVFGVDWMARKTSIYRPQVLKMLGKVWPLVNLTCLRGQGSLFCIKCKRKLPSFNHVLISTWSYLIIITSNWFLSVLTYPSKVASVLEEENAKWPIILKFWTWNPWLWSLMFQNKKYG